MGRGFSDLRKAGAKGKKGKLQYASLPGPPSHADDSSKPGRITHTYVVGEDKPPAPLRYEHEYDEEFLCGYCGYPAHALGRGTEYNCPLEYSDEQAEAAKSCFTFTPGKIERHFHEERNTYYFSAGVDLGSDHQRVLAALSHAALTVKDDGFLHALTDMKGHMDTSMKVAHICNRKGDLRGYLLTFCYRYISAAKIAAYKRLKTLDAQRNWNWGRSFAPEAYMPHNLTPKQIIDELESAGTRELPDFDLGFEE